MSFIDTLFGSMPETLNNRSKRFEMLTSNLANADTPGYKAVDIDFESLYAEQTNFSSTRSVALNRTNNNHVSAQGVAKGEPNQLETLYRVPNLHRLDGNTVETDMERMAFMENAIRYQVGLNLLDGKIKSIISTLRGE